VGFLSPGSDLVVRFLLRRSYGILGTFGSSRQVGELFGNWLDHGLTSLVLIAVRPKLTLKRAFRKGFAASEKPCGTALLSTPT
jgi:hypothetical protein